jgi:hypothetical protein
MLRFDLQNGIGCTRVFMISLQIKTTWMCFLLLSSGPCGFRVKGGRHVMFGVALSTIDKPVAGVPKTLQRVAGNDGRVDQPPPLAVHVFEFESTDGETMICT